MLSSNEKNGNCKKAKRKRTSLFLDNPVKEDYFVKKCCHKFPVDALKIECIENEEDFSLFLHFVTEYLDACFKMHFGMLIFNTNGHTSIFDMS